MESVRRKIALGIFAIVVVSAPLLFGSVDRIFQVIPAALLGIGILLQPPTIPVLSRRAQIFFLSGGALIVAKEFGPFVLFGDTQWHRVLSESFGVVFPATHNPEPSRALDSLLVMVTAATWFLWARTLASDRRNTVFVACTLVAAALGLALVCILTRGGDARAIYGIRYTPGWAGYGPFPNRNHTACFLAMGALLGSGCLLYGWRRREWWLSAGSAAALILVFFALLESRSRGGLVSFTVGFVTYVVVVIAKFRDRKAIAVACASAFVAASLCFAFGAKLLLRFNPQSDVPADLRWAIWREAATMWRDAPFFGHGLSTFEQIFPIYQNLDIENSIVLHPESDWLQWLTELGLLPLMAGVVAFACFVAQRHAALSFNRRSFYLRAAAFASLAVLACHAIYDVPAHRWAVGAYALALLAFAAPLRSGNKSILLPKRIALFPLGIATFWALPLFFSVPMWSPSALTKLLARNASSTSVRASDLRDLLQFFPLSPQLHQAVAVREVNSWPQSAWKHFRIADRLMPASWVLPAAQGIASKPVSPGMSLHFWSLAVERAGIRASEIFRKAVGATADLALAESFWSHYAETNPRFLLSYAHCVAGEAGRYYFLQWWKLRGLGGELREDEIQDFYALAGRFAARDQLDLWMQNNPGREERDYKTWARLLHNLQLDEVAWQILSRHISDSRFSAAPLLRPGVLELRWLENPNNLLNAQALAESLFRSGELEKCKSFVVSIASNKDAPDWFVRKAAYLQANDRQYDQAVSLLLR